MPRLRSSGKVSQANRHPDWTGQGACLRRVRITAPRPRKENFQKGQSRICIKKGRCARAYTGRSKRPPGENVQAHQYQTRPGEMPQMRIQRLYCNKNRKAPQYGLHRGRRGHQDDACSKHLQVRLLQRQHGARDRDSQRGRVFGERIGSHSSYS